MIIEIRKPINPIIKIPRAETFEIDLNSFIEGFLRICHTLRHFAPNVFNFSIAGMNTGNYEDL